MEKSPVCPLSQEEQGDVTQAGRAGEVQPARVPAPLPFDTTGKVPLEQELTIWA